MDFLMVATGLTEFIPLVANMQTSHSEQIGINKHEKIEDGVASKLFVKGGVQYPYPIPSFHKCNKSRAW